MEFIGYGEASLPPYLKENQQSVINFLNKVDLSLYKDCSDINIILDYIDNLSEGDKAAKAAVDIALHDLFGKINNTPLYQYLNISKKEDIYTSFTIGISDEESMKRKIAECIRLQISKNKIGD